MFVVPTDNTGAVLRPAMMDIASSRANPYYHTIPIIQRQPINAECSHPQVMLTPSQSPPRIAKILMKNRYSIESFLN